MRAAAIVCAKDEAPRIAAVLRVLTPIIDTLVVDDGSKDATAQIAKSCGAKVLSLSPNRGKGRAMLAGFELLAKDPSLEAVFFCDADLINLRQDHIIAAVNGVFNGEYDMVVGLRDYGPVWNKAQPKLPLISGERAVRRSFLASMPNEFWSGYGVEVAMNDHVARSGGIIGTVIFDGVSVHLKWSKESNLGAAKMVDMIAEVYKACEVTVERSILNRTIIGVDFVREESQPYKPLQSSQAPLVSTPKGDIRESYSPQPRTVLRRKEAVTSTSKDGLQIQLASKPATLSAQNASTEEVMDKLSSSIVNAATPALLPPVWTVATCICAALMGPIAAVGAGCLGIAHCMSCGDDD